MKIIPYAKGQKIAEPCAVSGMPIEVYHGDPCDGPSVSSSGLRLIEMKSPRHYFVQSPYNEKRAPQERADHFSIGAAAHTLLLGEDVFRERFAIRPDKWDSWRTTDAKAWRAQMEFAGKTVLEPKHLDIIEGMAESMARHPLVQTGILQGAVETSLFWRDETGVWLRSRPDVIPAADGVIVDLKTTTDAAPGAVERTIKDNGYALQGALAGMAMQAVLGVKMTDFVLLFVEKEPPYAINCTVVDEEWLWWARRQVRRAINTFATCVSTGEWPGYEGEHKAYMPSWMRKGLEVESDAGLLPKEEMA